jgi:hypothetical protein
LSFKALLGSYENDENFVEMVASDDRGRACRVANVRYRLGWTLFAPSGLLRADNGLLPSALLRANAGVL